MNTALEASSPELEHSFESYRDTPQTSPKSVYPGLANLFDSDDFALELANFQIESYSLEPASKRRLKVFSNLDPIEEDEQEAELSPYLDPTSIDLSADSLAETAEVPYLDIMDSMNGVGHVKDMAAPTDLCSNLEREKMIHEFATTASMAVITPTKTAKGINGFKGSNGVRDGGLQTRLPNATPTTTANVLDIAPPADGEHSSADNGICPLPIRAPRLPSKPASKHTFRPRVYSSHFPHPKAPTTEQAIKSIPNLHSAQDLIEFWKYPGEAHSVETKDGYILGLYRIPNPQHGFTAYTAPTPYKRPPVIIWHGLCISSNAFLCSPGGTDTNLALYLASEGFDVWLANSRGSRASRRHAKMPSPDEIMFHSKYWKYVGMDEMAKFDVPAVVDYVIAATGWKKVGYVGFSQGTAQMFMSLSMSEEMNSKIAFFAALAPAMKPKEIANRVLTRLTSYSPSLLFVMGCWSALPTAEWLRGRLFNKGYAQVIHSSLEVLMGWKNNKFPKEWWPALYMHLFAGGSVRNIVHWFQIITEQNFAPYDHEIAPHHLLPSHSSSRSKPPSLAGATLTHSIPTFAPTRTGPCPYPTQHITVPMRLFCGTEDNISAEPAVFKQSLPEARIETVEGYEHMDFIWDVNARTRVWETVLDDLIGSMKAVADDMGL